MTAHLAAALFSCLFLFTSGAFALSWPLCDSVGSTWTSASPHLSGVYPYYSLLFYCTGNMNLEGSGVDVCINHGKDCGLPAANAFCQYVGFDGAVEDQLTIVDATEPVRAVTGEWCTAPNTYSDAEVTNAGKLGVSHEAGKPFCQRIDSLVCYRGRSALSKTLASLRASVGFAPAPLSAAAPLSAPLAEASPSPPAVAPSAPQAKLVSASSLPRGGESATGGRRLLA